MGIQIYFQIASLIIIVSFGQLIFKYVGTLLNIGNNAISLNVVFYTLLGFLTYGLGSLLWIYILRDNDLSKVYPFLALTFVLVPLLSIMFFGERLSGAYFVGIALICGGIVAIAANAQ